MCFSNKSLGARAKRADGENKSNMLLVSDVQTSLFPVDDNDDDEEDDDDDRREDWRRRSERCCGRVFQKSQQP